MVDKNNENYAGHLTSFLIQYWAGPKKLVLFADVFYMLTTGIPGQWGAFAVFFLPFVPEVILEWIIFPIWSFLEVPPIPFEDY